VDGGPPLEIEYRFFNKLSSSSLLLTFFTFFFCPFLEELLEESSLEESSLEEGGSSEIS